MYCLCRKYKWMKWMKYLIEESEKYFFAFHSKSREVIVICFLFFFFSSSVWNLLDNVNVKVKCIFIVNEKDTKIWFAK